jgi:hypothetical protein
LKPNQLINIDNIINAPIIYDPWPYKIIDNILDQDVFDQFKNAATIVSAVNKDDEYYSDGIWPNEFSKLGIDVSLRDTTLAIADQLLTHQADILSQFPNHMKSEIGYYNIPRFNYSLGKKTSTIHDEGLSKTMALVIYIIPETTAGTQLYNGPDTENFVKEVEWKPNRGMLMMSQPGVTWHSYTSLGGPRYTLNLYFEKMESLSNFDNIKLDRKLWFYEQMGNNRLYSLI